MIYRPNETTYEQRLLDRIATETDPATIAKLKGWLEDERRELAEILSPPCDMSRVYMDELPAP